MAELTKNKHEHAPHVKAAIIEATAFCRIFNPKKTPQSQPKLGEGKSLNNQNNQEILNSNDKAHHNSIKKSNTDIDVSEEKPGEFVNR